MNIEYTREQAVVLSLHFEELVPGTWYQGVQTGRLYFFYTNYGGSERYLLRADNNFLCTERYQRSGTFRPVEVTVMVHAYNPEGRGPT